MKKQLFLLFLIAAISSVALGQPFASISGQVTGLTKDSVKIILSINDITRESKTYYTTIADGKFQQQVSVSKPTYFTLTDDDNYIFGLIEPMDNIKLTYDAKALKNTLSFEGRGSKKSWFLNSLIKAEIPIHLGEQVKAAKNFKYPFDHLLNYMDSIQTHYLQKLSSIKPAITNKSYNLLMADVKGNFIYNKYRAIISVHEESLEETLLKRKNELSTKARKTLENILKFDPALLPSLHYVNSVQTILYLQYEALLLANKVPYNLMEKYNYLGKLLPQNIRVPVLTIFLDNDIGTMNQAEDIEAIIQKIYRSSQDSIYKKYIAQKLQDASTFRKGTKAPDFTLENERGQKVTLDSFKGKVVYMDFWYAACGPCQSLFKAIKQVKEKFKDNNQVVFLNISIDAKDTWQKALRKFEIGGYHAFTENKEAGHEIIKAYKVGHYPTTCLIDKNGNFYAANPSPNPDELLELLNEALNKL